VKFLCHTKLLQRVVWERLDTEREGFAAPSSGQRRIYVGPYGLINEFRSDPRFTVPNESHSHSFVIYNVTVDDSAYYRCLEDDGFGNKHYYGLTVEGDLKYVASCTF